MRPIFRQDARERASDLRLRGTLLRRCHETTTRLRLGAMTAREKSMSLSFVDRSHPWRATGRRNVFAGRPRLCADLQGIRRVQLRAGLDGAVRSAELRRPAGTGPADLARRAADCRHHDCAGLSSGASGAAATGRPREISLFMATIGISFFLDGFGQEVWGSDVHALNIGIPQNPLFLGDILINQFDLIAAAVAGSLVAALALFLPVPPGSVAPCGRWPTYHQAAMSGSAFR